MRHLCMREVVAWPPPQKLNATPDTAFGARGTSGTRVERAVPRTTKFKGTLTPLLLPFPL